jgi:hypothetical protein
MLSTNQPPHRGRKAASTRFGVEKIETFSPVQVPAACGCRQRAGAGSVQVLAACRCLAGCGGSDEKESSESERKDAIDACYEVRDTYFDCAFECTQEQGETITR